MQSNLVIELLCKNKQLAVKITTNAAWPAV